MFAKHVVFVAVMWLLIAVHTSKACDTDTSSNTGRASASKMDKVSLPQ